MSISDIVCVCKRQVMLMEIEDGCILGREHMFEQYLEEFDDEER